MSSESKEAPAAAASASAEIQCSSAPPPQQHDADAVYALGIDIGTTSIKVVLLERTVRMRSSTLTSTSGTRQVSAHSLQHEAYPLDHAADSSTAEQSVPHILRAVERVLLQLRDSALAEFAQATTLGISCQMHGVCRWRSISDVNSLEAVWDRVTKGESLDFSSLITWEDKRCDENFLQRLNAIPSSSASSSSPPIAGLQLANGYGMTSLAWLALQQQAEAASFDHAGTIGDLLVYLLTEGHPHVMDQTNASSFGAFDVTASQWQLKRIAALGVDSTLLPRIVPSASPQGALHAYFQARWSLSSQLQIFSAVGDHPASVYALQPLPQQVILSMGTSSQVALVQATAASSTSATSASTSPSSVERRPYVTPFAEASLLLAASLNGGNVLSAFVCGLARAASDLADVPVAEATVWQRLLTEGQQLLNESQQSGQPLVLPGVDARFFAERYDPSVRGSINGLAHPLFTPALPVGGTTHLFLALCRGLITNLRRMLAGHAPLGEVDSIHLVGAAFERNPILRHYAAEVFAVNPQSLVIKGHDAAYGAALLALDTPSTADTAPLPLGDSFAVIASSSVLTDGWVRDLTTEGIETNPGWCSSCNSAICICGPSAAAASSSSSFPQRTPSDESIRAMAVATQTDPETLRQRLEFKKKQEAYRQSVAEPFAESSIVVAARKARQLEEATRAEAKQRADKKVAEKVADERRQEAELARIEALRQLTLTSDLASLRLHRQAMHARQQEKAQTLSHSRKQPKTPRPENSPDRKCAAGSNCRTPVGEVVEFPPQSNIYQCIPCHKFRTTESRNLVLHGMKRADWDPLDCEICSQLGRAVRSVDKSLARDHDHHQERSLWENNRWDADPAASPVLRKSTTRGGLCTACNVTLSELLEEGPWRHAALKYLYCNDRQTQRFNWLYSEEETKPQQQLQEVVDAMATVGIDTTFLQKGLKTTEAQLAEQLGTWDEQRASEKTWIEQHLARVRSSIKLLSPMRPDALLVADAAKKISRPQASALIVSDENAVVTQMQDMTFQSPTAPSVVSRTPASAPSALSLASPGHRPQVNRRLSYGTTSQPAISPPIGGPSSPLGLVTAVVAAARGTSPHSSSGFSTPIVSPRPPPMKACLRAECTIRSKTGCKSCQCGHLFPRKPRESKSLPLQPAAARSTSQRSWAQDSNARLSVDRLMADDDDD